MVIRTTGEGCIAVRHGWIEIAREDDHMRERNRMEWSVWHRSLHPKLRSNIYYAKDRQERDLIINIIQRCVNQLEA